MPSRISNGVGTGVSICHLCALIDLKCWASLSWLAVRDKQSASPIPVAAESLMGQLACAGVQTMSARFLGLSLWDSVRSGITCTPITIVSGQLDGMARFARVCRRIR